jgi:hypothetical protein
MKRFLPGLFVFAVLLAAWRLMAAPAEPKPNLAPTNSVATATTATASETNLFMADVPRSIFLIPTNSDQGLHDPFFPKSNRAWAASLPKAIAAPVDNTPVLTATIVSGVGDSGVASINGYPFKEGEEAEIGSANGRVKVRCVQITETNIVVEVNGQRKELRRPK